MGEFWCATCRLDWLLAIGRVKFDTAYKILHGLRSACCPAHSATPRTLIFSHLHLLLCLLVNKQKTNVEIEARKKRDALETDQFRLRQHPCFNKAAALRITLNIDGAPLCCLHLLPRKQKIKSAKRCRQHTEVAIRMTSASTLPSPRVHLRVANAAPMRKSSMT
jgi:hypothetical protein